jgi:Xaa-Pro aminopeptidase
MFGRGSIALADMIRELARDAYAIDGVAAIWRVRMIKSAYEVGLKRQSFEIVNAAFDDAIACARIGMSERELCSDMQARILHNGADHADAIAMTFGRGDFIYNRPPSDRPLQPEDYIWTDFRSPYGGYPADRNRIARAGGPTVWEETFYETVRTLTLEVARSIRPGLLCRDVFEVYKTFWAEAKLPQPYGLISRIGHGGGLDVTEPPSLSATDLTVISPGMVLHLEPKLELEGAVFQFEEIVHVLEQGVEFVSALSPKAVPIVER